MQLPCSLKTDFRLLKEVFECIVPVVFKVFSSLDFMLFSYEKVILSPTQSGFFFFMVVFAASEIFCDLWVAIFYSGLARNLLIPAMCLPIFEAV